MKTSAFILALLVSACASPEQIESKLSEISNPSGWSQMVKPAALTHNAAPVFAKALGQGWTAFAYGLDDLVYVTTETSPGVFSSNWTAVSHGEFLVTTRPSVAVLSNYNPPRFIVAVAGSDQQVHVQV